MLNGGWIMRIWIGLTSWSIKWKFFDRNIKDDSIVKRQSSIWQPKRYQNQCGYNRIQGFCHVGVADSPTYKCRGNGIPPSSRIVENAISISWQKRMGTLLPISFAAGKDECMHIAAGALLHMQALYHEIGGGIRLQARFVVLPNRAGNLSKMLIFKLLVKNL